ncbi:unnamed protein product [Chondrus crispus]|uniref:Uncharacterized protein n=1 Tax=Chondrus crispus TaxID=2769 RepID=R7Q5Z0_CHOCR|nr:unnamed protein product [Chondrus crispus]CDF33429.1 unnamed protein product [Chondrus crispus]|eukprot:XP_005713232.1 unnamed protein product [Chondrus crispus]
MHAGGNSCHGAAAPHLNRFRRHERHGTACGHARGGGSHRRVHTRACPARRLACKLCKAQFRSGGGGCLRRLEEQIRVRQRTVGACLRSGARGALAVRRSAWVCGGVSASDVAAEFARGGPACGRNVRGSEMETACEACKEEGGLRGGGGMRRGRGIIPSGDAVAVE